MRSRLRAAFLLGVIVSGSAHADADDAVSKELAGDLARMTRRPAPFPEVVRVTDDRMFELCRCRARALFKAPIVFLRDDIDLAGNDGRAVLLHEIVHGQQYAEHGTAKGCVDWVDREKRAVVLERRWRLEHGTALMPLPAYRCVDEQGVHQ